MSVNVFGNFVEKFWGKDIFRNVDEIGRGFFGSWFLDNAGQFAVFFGENAIFLNFGFVDFDTEDGRVGIVLDGFNESLSGGFATWVPDKIVAHENQNRFV